MTGFFADISAWLRSVRRLYMLRLRNSTSHIHRGVYVDDQSSLGRHNALFPESSLIASSIGDYTYVQKGSQICNSVVGKFCSIAMGVHIGLPRHVLDAVSTHPATYLKNTPLPMSFCASDTTSAMGRTSVGNDVWIGQGAMLMEGVSVGNGAVIGAGAIVTRDVPDYAVVVGVPARILRYRFDSNICLRLSESEWWNMDDDWLKTHVHEFADPLRLLLSLSEARQRSDDGG